MIELQERPPAVNEPSLTDAERARIQSLLRLNDPLPGAGPPDDTAPALGAAAAVWAPASARRMRGVERLVFVGLMAYFACGLLASLVGV